MPTKKDPTKPKKKISEKSLKNLIPFSQMDPARHRELSVKGAEVSNKLQHRRRTFAELIKIMGPMAATEREKERFLDMFPDADPDEISKDMMLIASMYNQGIGRGNVQAFTSLRDTAGEKPDTTINGTLTTQKVFISPEEQSKALEHIAEVIADDGADR